jgi:hypothetical protein
LARTFESGSQLGRIEELCLAFCSLHSIFIPRSIEALGRVRFAGGREECAGTKQHETRSVIFGGESRMRIEGPFSQHCSVDAAAEGSQEMIRQNEIGSVTFESKSRVAAINLDSSFS